jgi:nitronate monooxygenase
MKNEFIEKWHGREEKLKALQADELEKVEAASRVGDFDVANVTVGESIGMIHDLPEAGDVVRRVVTEAKERLGRYARVSLE